MKTEERKKIEEKGRSSDDMFDPDFCIATGKDDNDSFFKLRKYNPLPFSDVVFSRCLYHFDYDRYFNPNHGGGVWGNTAILADNEGVYIQDYPKVKNGRVIMNIKELKRKLQNQDPDVRFVKGEKSAYIARQRDTLVFSEAFLEELLGGDADLVKKYFKEKRQTFTSSLSCPNVPSGAVLIPFLAGKREYREHEGHWASDDWGRDKYVHGYSTLKSEKLYIDFDVDRSSIYKEERGVVNFRQVGWGMVFDDEPALRNMLCKTTRKDKRK